MLNCSRNDLIEAINRGKEVIVLGTVRYSWKLLGMSMGAYLKDMLTKVKLNANYEDKYIKRVVPIHTAEQAYNNANITVMEKGIPEEFKGVAYSYNDKIDVTPNSACIEINIGGKHIKRCITATNYYNRKNHYRTSYGMFGNCLIGNDYYSLFGEIIEVDEPHYCSTAYYAKMIVFYAIKSKDKEPFIIVNKVPMLAIPDDDIPLVKKKAKSSKSRMGTSSKKRSSKKQHDVEYEAESSSYYDESEVEYVEDDDEEYF